MTTSSMVQFFPDCLAKDITCELGTTPFWDLYIVYKLNHKHHVLYVPLVLNITYLSFLYEWLEYEDINMRTI